MPVAALSLYSLYTGRTCTDAAVASQSQAGACVHAFGGTCQSAGKGEASQRPCYRNHLPDVPIKNVLHRQLELVLRTRLALRGAPLRGLDSLRQAKRLPLCLL